MDDNERIVTKALDDLFTWRDLTAIDRYWRDPYVQHALSLANGIEALHASMRDFPVDFIYEPGLIMREGDEVVVHARVTRIAQSPVIVAQIFRLDRGRVVEHGESVQAEVPADWSATAT